MAEINEILSKQAIDGILAGDKAISQFDDSLQKLFKDIGTLNTEFEKVQKSSADAATKTHEYNKMLNQAADQQNKFVATAKEHQKIQQQLTTTEAKITAARSEGNKQLIFSKKELAERNKRLKLESVLNDENAGTIEKLNAEYGLLQMQKQKLKSTDANYKKDLKDINDRQNNINKSLKESSNDLQKQKINIGNYSSTFVSLTQSFANGEIGLKGLISGVWKLSKALITGIVTNPVLLVLGAIVGAVMLLVKAFKSTDDGATELAAQFERVKAILSVLFQQIQSVSNVIGKLFKGQMSLKEATAEVGESFKGTGQQMKNAADAAYDYIYAIDALNDAESNYMSQKAINENKIAKLEAIAQDRTLSATERKAAIEEAIAIGQMETQKQKEFADERYNQKVKAYAAEYGLSVEQINALVAADDKGALELMANDQQLADFRNKINDDKAKELEELYIKSIEADTKFFEENKRNISKLSSFEQEINKEREDSNKERHDKAVKSAADAVKAESDLRKQMAAYDAQLQKEWTDFATADEADMFAEMQAEQEAYAMAYEKNRQRQYQREKMLIESTVKDKEDQTIALIALNQKYLQEDLNSLNYALKNSELSAAERIDLEQQVADIQLELDQAVIDADNAKTDAQLANLDKIKERNKEIAAASIAVTEEFFAFRGAKIAGDLERLEQANEAGLLSDKEYAKQKAELEIKAAKNERAQALFGIAVNTATGVARAISDFGPPPSPLGIIGIASALLIGGLQTAAVLSAPLPQIPAFAKGTENSPSTGYIAGEAGRELQLLKSGEINVVDRATYFKGSKYGGAKIIPNNLTEFILSKTSHSGFSGSSFSDGRIVDKLDSIDRRLARAKTPIVNNGRVTGYEQSGNITNYLNRYR